MNKLKFLQLLSVCVLLVLYLCIDSVIGDEHTGTIKSNQNVIATFGSNIRIKPIGTQIYRGRDAETIITNLYISGNMGKGIVNAEYTKTLGNEMTLKRLSLKTSPKKYETIWMADKELDAITINNNQYYLEIAWRVIAVAILLAIAYLVKKYPNVVLQIFLVRTKFTPNILQKFFDENLMCMLFLLCIVIVSNDLIRLIF